VLELVDDAVSLIVEVIVIVTGSSDEEATIGKVTSVQRFVVLEKTQHESVAFGELAAQYPHSPPRFEEKPQSSGSFCDPSMHEPVSESAGSAQLVKSARI
jgi:hypothetical protein